MNRTNGDINDNEIRIISSINFSRPAKNNDETKTVSLEKVHVEESAGMGKSRKRKKFLLWVCAILAGLLVICFGLMFFSAAAELEEDGPAPTEEALSAENTTLPSTRVPESNPYVVKSNKEVDGVHLTVLTPLNATPTLVIGNDALNDSKIVLAVQASDIRGDNGEIAGLFVVKGNLVSRGEARAGFCSIIDGEMAVGVADATSMLEQALTSGGYFFRQFPLVVGGQVVENKPKGKALRKALAEIDGRICVIMSDDRVSYHDFSQALVDAGVRNAIALVGGNSLGRYTDAGGNTVSFGKKWEQDFSNINYIVWR